MTPTLKLLAPAKLNLSLRILGRRPDGFHELETLFERIDLADELTFSAQPELVLTCNEPSLPCGDTNLVMKAARLLQTAMGATQGAAIHLRKNIPIAAGLGGGSSDAAATLLGLNRFWGLRVEVAQLLELGAHLGSDVPFFVQPNPFTIGRGRGEQCEAIPGPLPVLWHVLVVPPAKLSTKEVYQGFDAAQSGCRQESQLTAATSPLMMMAHALRNGSLSELAKGLGNDLEPEAIRRCPVIHDILVRLRDSGCVGVQLSGSGPSVFGLCADEAQARGIARQIQHDGPSHWYVQTVSTF